MSSLFDGFDSYFEKLFNSFQRPVLDQRPYSVYKEQGKGFIILVNTLGISKENIDVHIERQKGSTYPILIVKGETKLKDVDFSNRIDLHIALRLDSEVQDIKYVCKDGLTTVYLKTKVEEIAPIQATYIDDNTSFDW